MANRLIMYMCIGKTPKGLIMYVKFADRLKG